MEKEVRQLIGSPARDIFRWTHKQIFPSGFYASDIDLVLISPEEDSTPDITLALLSKKDILAFIEYKTKLCERITWAEETLYDDLDSKGYLIYIVRGPIHTTLRGKSIAEMINNDSQKNSIFNPNRDEILRILRKDFEKLKVFRYIKKNNKFTEKKESDNFIIWELGMRKKKDEIIRYRNEHYGK